MEKSMNLRDALIEVQALKAMWREKRFDEYYLRARAFPATWRESIRKASQHPQPSLQTIRCLEALLVIHSNIATASDDIREADEDLFLDVAPRYRPSTVDQQIKHNF